MSNKKKYSPPQLRKLGLASRSAGIEPFCEEDLRMIRESRRRIGHGGKGDTPQG